MTVAALTIADRLGLVGPEFRDWYRQNFHRFTWIYAIQEGDDGPIKVGTAKDPDERLATLQCGNPTKLHGLTAWQAPAAEEQAVHKEFASAHIRGEWFHPDPQLIEFIEAIDTAAPFWFREDMPPEMVELVFG